MGKTFRREKTFGGKRKENQGMGKKPRLNTHRDLPDYQESLDEDYPIEELEAEEYHAKTIHILKQNMTSDAKVQRILKSIEDNAKADRKKALALVKKAETTLEEIETRVEVSERTGTHVADAYTSVFNSIILALNQAGIANERLIKLATVIQKFTSGKASGKEADPEKSLFASLSKISKKEEDD